MRLFLSSYRAGKHESELKNFLDKIDKVAVITNAKDYKFTKERQVSIEDNFNWWRSIGLKPTEIDLRPHFGTKDNEKLLSKHNFIWLAGGNVFLLRRALSYTGLDKYFYDAVRKNEIILGGESAGAIIMGPTLKYSEVDTNEDSPNFTPAPYEKKAIWDGLHLLEFVPVPHYQTQGYIGIEEYISNLKKENIPHKKMTDDQVITVSRGRAELLT